MRVLRLVSMLVLLSLAAPGSSGTPSDPSSPTAALALMQPGGAILAWIPGAVVPDYYVIYGVDGDSMVPISVAPPEESVAEVAGAYLKYAVAGVIGGIASQPTFAATISQGCITIETNPPDVGICGAAGVLDKLRGKLSLAAMNSGLP